MAHSEAIKRAPVDVLITAPLPVVGAEATGNLIFHRLWESPDASTFLDEVGPRIRGIAAGGRVQIDAEVLDRLPAVEIIASFGVGYDRVDVAAARDRGMIVTNTPDVLTEEVADLAFGLLIATLRQLPQADRFVREGHWLSRPFPLSASLRGRTVGILGLGRIGKAIARRLDASAVKVVYHGRTQQADVPYDYYASPLAMAHAVDTLVLVAPGTTETDGLINAEVLATLGPTGVLINVARGSVVDETALVKALQNRTILAAGLDVFQDEPKVPADLIALDNVVLLPHVGSGSTYTRDAMGQLVLDNLVAWFQGQPPLTPVPETPLEISKRA
jgi:lactate dehydrogenase-like 2-hydroxyacid dehydrogenase